MAVTEKKKASKTGKRLEATDVEVAEAVCVCDAAVVNTKIETKPHKCCHVLCNC